MVAQWIWTDTPIETESFALLRRSFELSEKPASALLRLSANQRYKLFVNGVEVGVGPALSYPAYMFYDEVEIAPLLRSGANVLAVLAHNHGTEMPSVLQQVIGPPGFWCELEIKGQLALTSEANWKTLPAPQYELKGEIVIGHRGGYKEHCHPALEPAGWTDLGFDEAGWQGATLVPEGVFGGPHPTEIPPKRHWVAYPEEVYAENSGVAYGEVFLQHGELARKAGSYDIRGQEALLSDSPEWVTINPVTDLPPALLLDFGRDCVGTLELDFEEAGEGVLELAFGESLHLTVVDRLYLRAGKLTWSPFYRRVGRYVRLRFWNLTQPVKLRAARFICESYGGETIGRFECSDSLLNRIWKIGVDTLDCCMQDVYEDCPWREQSLYGGDMRVASMVAYYAKGGYDFTRKSLRQLARTQHESGAIPTVGPAPSPLNVIPEFPAHWLGALSNYYLYTGDKALVEELFPTLVRLVSWFESELDDQSLMSGLEEGSKWFHFVDNLCGIEPQYAVTATQAYCAQAVGLASELAELLGHFEEATAWLELATRMSKAIQLFWDKDSQAFIDGSSQQRAPEPPNEISNGVPLWCGLTDKAQSLACLEQLARRRPTRATQAAFSNYFLTEALYLAGWSEIATARICKFWGGMLERGATTFWEVFDEDWPAGKLPHRLWSLCHEFSAGPVALLPAYVLGVRPLEAGFRKVLVAPQVALLDWAEGAVPTPHGLIHITWRKTDDKIRLEVQVPCAIGSGALQIQAPPNCKLRATVVEY